MTDRSAAPQGYRDNLDPAKATLNVSPVNGTDYDEERRPGRCRRARGPKHYLKLRGDAGPAARTRKKNTIADGNAADGVAAVLLSGLTRGTLTATPSPQKLETELLSVYRAPDRAEPVSARNLLESLTDTVQSAAGSPPTGDAAGPYPPQILT
ncbi:hypothetical protein SKAU_G00023370 [Synaphobranchus kaupii]|uniref:Uncharacterized protein n=1 Tax=Synaphobranchus kaupii TaxID=118154 RepID=A0A9Q1GCC0_SYNKA|nr:hypothetical protein SKAU_G00023370 [Synaphobranchus kaupii]